MKNILLILILIFISDINAQTLKAGIGLVTTETDDQYCDESFIAGYESAGGNWRGDLDIIDSLYSGQLSYGDYIGADYLSADYDLVTWNSSGSNVKSLIKNSSRGLQYFLPSGTNTYRVHTWTEPIIDPIVCGSGWDSSITGYACEFWDRDPYGYNDTIQHIVQGGTQFTISKLIRYTDSTLGVRLTGNTSAVGFEHGVPIRLSGITGTNILPLPSGLYYVTYALDNYLILKCNTSSGTINSEQTPTAGVLKVGTADNMCYIKTSHYNLLIYGFAYTIYGVTGFSNNPNRAFPIPIQNYVEDGYGDKLEIEWNLGSGTYAGGGHTTFNSQSYATPYIAGKIAFIKDSVANKRGTPCSWWEARYRARMTASGNGNYDSINGYGRINVLAAINYKGKIAADPFKDIMRPGKISAQLKGSYVTLTFDLVPNSTSYKIFDNGALIKTILAESDLNSYYYSIKRTTPGKPHRYSYKAVRDSTESEESDQVIVPYYYYNKIRIK